MTTSTSPSSSVRGSARLRFTGRGEGDLRPGTPGVEDRRRAVVDHPWTWLRQVHGVDAVVVGAPGALSGATADVAVTAVPGAVVSVSTADCAPVALVGRRDGADVAVGAVHAGWRGLEAGVVAAAVQAVVALGATEVRAVVGPCIAAPCYEFGAADLDRVAEAVGERVRGRTSDGRPALDLAGGVVAALHAVGVHAVEVEAACTACSGHHWSHRARGDAERQALAAWLEPA